MVMGTLTLVPCALWMQNKYLLAASSERGQRWHEPGTPAGLG